MNWIALGLSILAIVPAVIHAQDSPVGKYTGSYETSGIANARHSVTVEISSVEDGRVKGVATRNSTARTPGCRGQYTIEGTYKDNKLSLRETEKGGSAGDCAFRFTGTRKATHSSASSARPILRCGSSARDALGGAGYLTCRR